jgi:hypothetical protein
MFETNILVPTSEICWRPEGTFYFKIVFNIYKGHKKDGLWIFPRSNGNEVDADQ